MQIASPIIIALANLHQPEILLTLPNTPGVYAFVAGAQAVHVSWCSHLATRINRMLAKSSGRSDTLGARMRDAGYSLHCWPTTSKLESSLLMYYMMKASYPKDYRERLRLRLPWFVAFSSRDQFPRIVVSNRTASGGELAIGPFRTRDHAQRYADSVLGLSLLRRCSETLNPNPNHPGCIYGEIKQCLRPCQTAVGATEYEAEVQRMAQFLLTNGKSSLIALSKARSEAANAMNFERAAELHRQIKEIQETGRGRDELISDTRDLTGVALTQGSSENEWRLWRMTAGTWQQSRNLEVNAHATVESVSVSLRGLLEPLPDETGRGTEDTGEHLAVLVRWYYSSWRDGLWFQAGANGRLNYRRIARHVLRTAPVPDAVQT